MTKKFIESADQKIKREKEQVVKQLEGARREISLAKRFLDAPKEDPYWDRWKDDQVSQLAALQHELTGIQKKIRELTLEFVEEPKTGAQTKDAAYCCPKCGWEDFSRQPVCVACGHPTRKG